MGAGRRFSFPLFPLRVRRRVSSSHTYTFSSRRLSSATLFNYYRALGFPASSVFSLPGSGFAGGRWSLLPRHASGKRKLQLEYLDLYLIHWPINLRKGASHPIPKEEDFLPLDIKSVWRGLEQCVELGLTKSIGVSNFSCKKIEDLLTYAKIPPAVNQVEMHPLWQQKKLRDYCSNVKIHVSAYSPLGSSGTYYGTNAAMENTVIQEIAKRRGKTVAQVLLRWGLEQGVSVLPKSYNKGRIADNYQIFDWSLTRNDHEKISELEQKKIVRRDELINSTTSPYKTIEDLWDGEI